MKLYQVQFSDRLDGQEAHHDDATHDTRLIAECLNDMSIQNASWISAAGITPISVRSENLVSNLEGPVTRVARLMKLPDGVSSNVTVATRRQSRTERTADRIDRYATDRRRSAAPGCGLGNVLRRMGSAR